MKTMKPFIVFAGALMVALCVSPPVAAQTAQQEAWVQQQVESLAGSWRNLQLQDWMERGEGPPIGDYAGLPINEAARAWADAWDSGRLSLQEHQCNQHIIAYASQAPFPIRISMLRDPVLREVIAVQIWYRFEENMQTIWLDGRPHPSKNARRLFNGFSTGTWDGNVLTAHTTHIKQGWLRRNGIPYSQEVDMTEYWTRQGNTLTHFKIVTDPIFLTEPITRTEVFAVETNMSGSWLWPCEASKDEVSGKSRDWVPHYLWGENPWLNDASNHTGVPFEANRGGAETMYPEYQSKLRQLLANPPARK
jgi:hypothetical protein